jgi:uridylate kinase
MALKYRRVMLKLSGETLMGDQQYGIDSKMLTYYTKQIKELIDIGVEVAVVIGGGNIFRGLSAAESGVPKATIWVCSPRSSMAWHCKA